MQISKVSSTQYNQNFGGVRKIVSTAINDSTITKFVSEKGKYLGKQILKANGDVKGERFFSNGASIIYNTSHGTLAKTPYVPMEYHFPSGKGRFERRLLVFDLDKFKENMKELTSLAGIKRYFAKIEKAPKTTKFEPCC